MSPLCQSRQPASPPLRFDDAEIERESCDIPQGGSPPANNAYPTTGMQWPAPWPGLMAAAAGPRPPADCV